MRRLAACLLVIALAAPGAASAQSKPRRVIPPAPKVEAPAAPSTPVRPSLPSLRMTGLPPVPDGGGVCRATCSKERYSCSGEDDASDCSNRWLTCLATCRAQ